MRLGVVGDLIGRARSQDEHSSVGEVGVEMLLSAPEGSHRQWLFACHIVVGETTRSVGEAAAQGYKGEQGKPTPYHGYHFRLLTAQGKDAPGGARSYLAHGKLLGGFAVVAYPATYGNSGIMTFIANQDGVVHQKDLGANTAALAKAMKAYNPDKSWTDVK